MNFKSTYFKMLNSVIPSEKLQSLSQAEGFTLAKKTIFKELKKYQIFDNYGEKNTHIRSIKKIIAEGCDFDFLISLNDYYNQNSGFAVEDFAKMVNNENTEISFSIFNDNIRKYINKNPTKVITLFNYLMTVFLLLCYFIIRNDIEGYRRMVQAVLSSEDILDRFPYDEKQFIPVSMKKESQYASYIRKFFNTTVLMYILSAHAIIDNSKSAKGIMEEYERDIINNRQIKKIFAVPTTKNYRDSLYFSFDQKLVVLRYLASINPDCFISNKQKEIITTIEKYFDGLANEYNKNEPNKENDVRIQAIERLLEELEETDTTGKGFIADYISLQKYAVFDCRGLCAAAKEEDLWEIGSTDIKKIKAFYMAKAIDGYEEFLSRLKLFASFEHHPFSFKMIDEDIDIISCRLEELFGEHGKDIEPNLIGSCAHFMAMVYWGKINGYDTLSQAEEKDIEKMMYYGRLSVEYGTNRRVELNGYATAIKDLGVFYQNTWLFRNTCLNDEMFQKILKLYKMAFETTQKYGYTSVNFYHVIFALLDKRINHALYEAADINDKPILALDYSNPPSKAEVEKQWNNYYKCQDYIENIMVQYRFYLNYFEKEDHSIKYRFLAQFYFYTYQILLRQNDVEPKHINAALQKLNKALKKINFDRYKETVMMIVNLVYKDNPIWKDSEKVYYFYLELLDND